ncbi:hypothetical protein ASC64_16830 [Nocardioides sp. Root122]|nr:hypothetical protein ASC64_16830 [Nocardioides sp. Root122]
MGCSHTTVSKVFSSSRVPAWGIVELLVESMGGDAGELKALWVAATGGATAPAVPPVLAGRRRGLPQVRRHLTSGSGLLLVTGEAGMGKTRLVGTAARLEADEVFVAAGHCLRLSTEVPMLPVADVLQAVLSVDDGHWLTAALAGCPAYVPGALRHLLPELEVADPAPDVQDDWARQRLFAAVEATVAALAASRPLALLVEDLHWSDAATFDLLEHLATRGLRAPVLGTWRTVDPDTGPEALAWLLRVRRLAGVQVLELAPLTRDETADQLAQLLPWPVEPAIVDRVHGRSRGHPLFTEHLAADTSTGDNLPGALTDVLDQRLQGLGPEAWSVATTLGVADRPLDARELVAVTGLPTEGVTLGLRSLAGRRLLFDVSAREVQLGHPLLAEAIRRAVVASEGADLHRRLAEVLGAGPAPSAAEVAAHWEAAGDRSEELDWRVRAAKASEERFALANAAVQWLRVLELWPPGAASAGTPAVSRWAACRGAIDALDYSGEIPRSVEIVEGALSWAAELTPLEAGEVYARAGGYRTFFREPAAGLPLLDRAIELLSPLPPSPGHLVALSSRAEALAELGRDDEASAAWSAAVDVSGALGDPVRHREASLRKATHDYLTGDRTALGRVADLAALATPRPDPLGDIRSAQDYSYLLRLEGARHDEVRVAARRGLEVADSWGIDDWGTANLTWNFAEAAWVAGRVAEAAATIDPLTAGPLVGDRAPLYLARAMLDTLRGRPDAHDGLGALDEIVPTLRVFFVPFVAEVRLWRCEPQTAFDLLVGDLERRIAGGFPRAGIGALLLLARSAADIVVATPRDARPGRRRELGVTVDRLVGAMDALPPDLDDHMDVATPAYAAAYAAERARLADRQTVDAWVAVARQWDRLERPHDAAYARWRAAQVAVASGQAAAADRLLRRAAQQAKEHAPLLALIAALRRPA